MKQSELDSIKAAAAGAVATARTTPSGANDLALVNAIINAVNADAERRQSVAAEQDPAHAAWVQRNRQQQQARPDLYRLAE